MERILGLLNSRNRMKRIDASKPVLDTYHESFLYGKVALTVRVRGTMRSGWIGLIWHCLEFVLAIASGVLYVYSTYKDYTKYNWASVAQNYISLFFAIDYGLRVYSDSARLCYIFSLRGLIDLLSAVPVVYFIRSVETNGRFLRLLQFLRIIRIISLINKLGVLGSTILQQILLLIISTFGAVFLIAGVIHYVEYHGAPQSRQAQCPEEGCINFWDAFYFVIVTISTVGYGDITPETVLGRLVAILTILGALIILPIQIGRITFLASRRPYGGSFDSKKVIESRFLIITGSFTFQELQEYLAEFYNPTHCEDLEIYPLRVNILAPFSPSFELKQLLSLYNGLVEFIEGSPIKQSDLARVCAERASAIFLLAKKDSEDHAVEDAAQILKALAIHRYCKDNVRIIVEVLEPETQASAVWDLTDNRGIEVICPIKFHYRMIARSCLVKGLYTFITNMFTSEIKMKTLPQNSFLSEYFRSFDNEVYPLIFPKACYGMLFEEVVEFVFENFNAVLFALDVNVIDPEKHQTTRKVFLHPKGHVITADDVGLLICSDLGSVFAVSRFDDKNSEEKKWKPRKKRGLSSVELQNFRTGPVVDDVKQCSPPDPMSYTAVNPESLESRMKTEIFTWHGSDESRHGTDRESRHGTDRESRHGTDRESRHGTARESRHGTARESRHGTGRESKHGNEDSIEAGYGKKLLNGERDHSKGRDSVSLDDSESEDEGLYPRGMSLEKATDLLLAWPPLGPALVQPHASVLERRQDVILENLKSRTIGVVSLNAPHILVCCQNGWPQEMFYFVKELRKPDMPNPPVVVLYPNQPTAIEWGKVGIFEDVFYCKGSPIYELDLMRGGVLHAERVVILGCQDTPVDLSVKGVEDSAHRRVPSAQRSDVDNIVIAANVERLVGMDAGVMLVDMQHTFALHYLRPKFEVGKDHVKNVDYRRNPEALVHFGPPFMEGKAVSPALMGFLLRSSFYNKNTLSIVEQLIGGGHTLRDGSMGYKNLRILRLVPVAPHYVDRPYGDLFVNLLHEKGVLALGLYRTPGTLGAPAGYVFTNPPKHCRVSEGDQVYIIV